MKNPKVDQSVVEAGEKVKQVVEGVQAPALSVAMALPTVAGHLSATHGLSRETILLMVERGIRTAEEGMPASVALAGLKQPPEPISQVGMGASAQEIALETLDSLFERATEKNIPQPALIDAVAYAVVVFTRALQLPLSAVTERLGLASYLVDSQRAEAEKTTKAEDEISSGLN